MKLNFKYILLIILFSSAFISCNGENKKNNAKVNKLDKNAKLDSITFGGGCFWCVEAVFLELKGVVSVTSGYEGGFTQNPTYKEVCSGNTGHAEVCKVVYDSNQIDFKLLLDAFFASHDPTTLNKQGNDIGTQYRSVIYYFDENQKLEAENFIQELTKANVFENKIVTEVKATSKFYPAEDYHQNYYALNSNQSYCAFVINPKLEKFRKKFKEKLK